MKTVRDVMTSNVVALPSEATLQEAARAMRDAEIGDVVVVDGSEVAGIATDRDIVVRAVAEGLGSTDTTLAHVTSRGELATITYDAPAADAAALMRERAVRRLVVIAEDGGVVGIVSLGDLAGELDPDSVVGSISNAPANN